MNKQKIIDALQNFMNDGACIQDVLKIAAHVISENIGDYGDKSADEYADHISAKLLKLASVDSADVRGCSPKYQTLVLENLFEDPSKAIRNAEQQIRYPKKKMYKSRGNLK